MSGLPSLSLTSPHPSTLRLSISLQTLVQRVGDAKPKRRGHCHKTKPVPKSATTFRSCRHHPTNFKPSRQGKGLLYTVGNFRGVGEILPKFPPIPARYLTMKLVFQQKCMLWKGIFSYNLDHCFSIKLSCHKIKNATICVYSLLGILIC